MLSSISKWKEKLLCHLFFYFSVKNVDNNYLEENPIKCYKKMFTVFSTSPTWSQTWLGLMWKQQQQHQQHQQQQPTIDEIFKNVNFVLSLNGAFVNTLFSLTQNICCTSVDFIYFSLFSTIKNVPLMSEWEIRSAL